jgi:hypothetical protein
MAKVDVPALKASDTKKLVKQDNTTWLCRDKS